MVGTWRGTDSEPKELFVNHQAGLAGHGGSSYIDTVALRDKDSTNGWTGTPDGTREQRHYYAQNWRADVSAIVDSSGEIQEWDKYRAYGVPFLLTPADHTKDGAVAKADNDSFAADYAAGNLRADLNKSGTVTTADQTIFNASYAKAVVGGRWKLSAPDIANRKGYAGYEHDGDLPELAHVRHRVLHFGLGRWTRRDPLGYVDGASLTNYVQNAPLVNVDPTGETLVCVGCGACLIAVGLSCGALCLEQPWWDTPGEGFGMCMLNCIAAALGMSYDALMGMLTGTLPTPEGLAMLACDFVCGRCLHTSMRDFGRWLGRTFPNIPWLPRPVAPSVPGVLRPGPGIWRITPIGPTFPLPSFPQVPAIPICRFGMC